MGFLVNGDEYKISMILKFENYQTPSIKNFSTNMMKSQTDKIFKSQTGAKNNLLPHLNYLYGLEPKKQ